MQKVVRKFICFLFVFSLSLVLAPQVCQSRLSSNAKVVTSTYKKAPGANATSYRASRGPVQLSIGNSFKRKPQARKPIAASTLRRKLTARSAIIIDSNTGEVIYAHAPDVAAQPASTIKILTGVLAINYLKDNDQVKISRKAARMPRSKMYLHKGRMYPADDLINAVLLSSANDASVALAEDIAGSEKVFARLMTYKAKVWGAKKTICKTATGLTARGQQSTARDLAVLFERAMDVPEFAARVEQKKVRTKTGKILRNHNRALWRLAGAEGGKTGFTNAARQTYVGKFGRDTGSFTVAVMGSETMWDDIANLVDYGFKMKRYKGSLASVIREVSGRLALNRARSFSAHPLIILSENRKKSSL